MDKLNTNFPLSLNIDTTKLVGTPGSKEAYDIGKKNLLHPNTRIGNATDKFNFTPWGIAATIGGDVAGMIQKIRGKDVIQQGDSMVDNVNASQMSTQTNGDTWDNLMSDWSSNYNMDHVTKDDFGAKDFGEGLVENLASGNVLTSIFGNIGRNSKINKQVDRVNEVIDYRNQYNLAQLNNRADNLMKQQFNTLNANYAALGGPLATNGIDWPGGLITIDAGGSHSENPYDGVPMGMDEEGNPNLVEEGETIFDDYVFSRRLKVPKAIRKKYKLGGPISFADASKKLAKEAEERPNDPISQKGLRAFMADLANAQEQVRAGMNKNKFSKGGYKGNKHWDGSLLDRPIDMSDLSWMEGLEKPIDVESTPWWNNVILPAVQSPDITLTNNLAGNKVSDVVASSKGKGNTFTRIFRGLGKMGKNMTMSDLRYVPAIGSLFGTVKSMIDSPDYEMADALIKEGKGVTAPTVGFTPIGNYIEENPMDRMWAINQLNAQSGATRRGIVNTAGLNRANAMAGLLAADNSFLNSIGSLNRQAAEANYANKLQARTFNRATNQYNSEGMLKAGMANAESKMKAKALGLETISKGYELRQKARDVRDAAISANMTNLFDNIGNIGWEEYQRKAIESNPALMGWYLNRAGDLGYKSRSKSSKNGGFLTIKKK